MTASRRSRATPALAALLWAAALGAIALVLPPALDRPALWAAAALGPALGLLLARAACRGETAALARRIAALETAAAPKAGRGRDAPVRERSGDPAAAPAIARPSQPAASTGPARSVPAASPVCAPSAQADLPIAGADAQASWPDVVRALDFPRDEDDEEGMAALRSALRDPLAARVLQAAEDVLSILAAHGLHMEDLRPEPPDPAAWLAYAGGARGAAIDAVGAVRDAATLDAARALLRADPVLRDAAMVFASRWGLLAPRAAAAYPDGAALSALADTRSGRAFMLLARALGAFD